MSELNKVKLTNNAEYNLKDDTGTLSSHLHHDEDLIPLISKTYASTSYYATTNDYANASWYFMSVKPNAWYQPWTVRFKVRTKCPNQVDWYSYTWATISGRTDGVIYANWNEQSTTAHTYITFYPLKQAGFNAGYGHAIGISIYNGNAPTTANNYRTFEIDYYSCDNCTVDILDTPVKWENWTGTGTTNYGSLSSFNANSRGLQESGDANDIDAIYVYFGAKTGAQGIWAGSLFMQDGNKTYQNICTAADGTATNANRTTATTKLANANGFLVGGTVYYSSANYNANTNISNWSSARSRVGNVFDARYSFNVTLTANSLTPYASVYLVGTINSTDGLFYLDQVWWTQTPNATDKVYVLVGGVYDSTTSNCRIVLYEDNPWYKYDGSKLVELTNGHIVNKDVPSDAVFTDHIYTGTNYIGVNSSTNVISHNNSGVTAGTYRSVTVDAKGHVTAGANNTSIEEEYLSWGGPSKTGQVSPIGLALSEEHSGNKLAFINGDALTIEYSNNDGSTYTNYNYEAFVKSAFCTKITNVPIGRTDASSSYTTSMRTRITLTAQNGTSQYVYTNPRKMLINMNTSGGVDVLIETRTGANYLNDGAWNTYGMYSVAGWTGWNDIPLVLSTLGGGSTQTSNIWQLRLTFIVTSIHATSKTCNVLGMRIFGQDNWYTPSTLGSTGHLYSFDMNKDATFPGNVKIKSDKQVGYLTATPTNNQVVVADGTTGGLKTSGYTIAKSVPSDAVFTDHTYSGTGLISVNSSGVISTTAEVNQNAFSNIKVGSTTIEADSKTDTVELVAGNNITLTPDATNDTITIEATGGGSSTDEKVKQSPSTANTDLRVLLSKSANDDEETDFVRKSSALKYNPSTGNLKTTQLNGVNVGSSPVFTDEKVTQTESTSDDANYRVVLSGSSNSTTKTEGVKKCDHFICNPNNADVSIVSGKVTTRTIIQNTTASANDFAEARLELGNSKETTAAKSSFGNLRIFDQSQYYTNIYHNTRLTANRSLRLPNQTGTIAITDDIKNATLTIRQNGTSVGDFSSNASTASIVDLTDNQVRMFPVPSNADGYYWLPLCDSISDHVGQLVYKTPFQVNTTNSVLLVNDSDGYLQVGSTISGSLGKYGNLRVDLGVAYMRSTSAGQNLVWAASGENDYRIKLGVWANGSGGANSWMFAPTANGKLLLGAANCRWGQIYSTSSSISTSDRREKKDITPLDEKAKELIMALNPVSYKFIDGNSGRTHYGMIAQDVEEEMTEIGLTPMDVAAFCKDQKTVPYVDSNGDEKDMPVQGEYVYGLRYEEFIAPMIKTIQMQQQEINELKSELAEIKALLLNR